MENKSGSFLKVNTRRLVDCAMGRLAADLVVRGGRWVCVQAGEIIDNCDISVLDGRIAYVGKDAEHTIDKTTKIIDAKGRYMVPGLLDAHVHVESGMLTITEFVRAVIPRGTTGMFIDPHEIANVFGLDGVRLMVDEASVQPIHVLVQMPSCVPSAPGLETPGASIGPAEVKEAMGWEGIIGLGEVMNFPGVASGDEKMHEEMAETRAAGKVIGGHYASPDLGLPFSGYVAGGPQDDHEGTRLEDAVARARQGMKVIMRYGSGWKDVAAQVKAVTELGMESRAFLLCTDDCHSETLVREGHMDRVVRHTMAQGLQPMKALQMATINTAEHFGVSRHLGMIAPGRHADILLIEKLEDLKPDIVIARGLVVAEKGNLLVDLADFPYPERFLRSVHLKRPLIPGDFRLSAPANGELVANVIEVIENQAPTRKLQVKVKASNMEVAANPERDLAKIALVERHQASGRVQVGLVHGFGLKGRCAVATTVAHDSHHMIIAGTDETCMAQAGNELYQCGGGQIVIKDGKVIAKVELPIAGLMSNERADVVAAKAGEVLIGFRKIGCPMENPNMQLSLMALVVIPELRISDLGLVDVNQFSIIPVFE